MSLCGFVYPIWFSNLTAHVCHNVPSEFLDRYSENADNTTRQLNMADKRQSPGPRQSAGDWPVLN